ncbi:MAG TPA: alpha/beta hydrolase [Polyangiaceae bacterium]|jgi:pimeloyl-ACP methyl ester carboxylesterase|nr:alpha/beta hydrolase [Polyangiaceae bacterium]
MSFVLHHRFVGAAEAPKLAFVLHGALGSGQNFSRFSQKLAERRPDYRHVLVDLRHHGQSSGAHAPNTLAACADDLRALARHLGREPAVLIGHSFGGKVSIEYARDVAPEAAGPAASALQQVWVLDAVPGEQPDGEQNSEVSHVIAAVRSVPMPAASRRDVVNHLITSEGLSSGLAEWMATNLKREGQSYSWVFDLDGIEELMRDYFRVDLWGFLAQPRTRPRFELVVAERSDRWTPELRARARGLPPSAQVRYHELPDSGHWVHVDNPGALLDLMAAQLL